MKNKIPHRKVHWFKNLIVKWSQKVRKSENLNKSKGNHSSVFFRKKGKKLFLLFL
jgi:hypothetical protein